jgi:hypothetical protein
VEFRTVEDLEAGLADIRSSPVDEGRIELIVRRPAVEERDVVAEAVLDTVTGLVGDNWVERRSSRNPDRLPNVDEQVTVMNWRAAALIAGVPDRVPLAGDQLYIDLDLSTENLEPGTRLALGDAVIEVSPEPHTGCAKFAARFGRDAVRFVNSEAGRSLRLRGLNARVVVPGAIRVGDVVRKLP